MASDEDSTTANSAQSAQPGSAVVDMVEGYQHGLKDDLLKALSSIQTPGSFASFGVLPRVPPAGLFVDGIGDIAMPLSVSQAHQLIAKARQAPYGKGSATIVDTTVRNTWELDAEQLTFRDPSWPSFIRNVCAQVAVDLGINAPITAQIYKMLIYEKGAMFKAHTDTEKIPHMFGTLIVCLPSMHKGGEVVVKHCGKIKVFKTSEAPQSFACWYSDVSHEVLPVTSGFRWVVTYNLALDSTAGPGPSAGLQRSETQALRRTLKMWLSEPKESRKTNCIYHMLDHEYTEASISLKALKTRDLAQVRALKDISSELPVNVFLALLELREIGNCEPEFDDPRFSRSRYYDDDDYYYKDGGEVKFHEMGDILESDYTVRTLVDLEGRVVTQGMRFDPDDVLQDGCFDDLDPEEEYEGYMGNSGPTVTHWYRVTAVVLVPHDSLLSFFDPRNCSDLLSSISPDMNAKTQVQYLARACLGPRTPKSLFDALVTRCRTIFRIGAEGSSIDRHSTRDMLKAAILHGSRTFFEEAAGRHGGLLPLNFFVWLQRWLRQGGSVPYGQFNAIQNGICSAIQSYPHFADRFKAITNLVPIPNGESVPPETDATPAHVLNWAREKLLFYLGACASKPLGRDDGPAMVDMAFYFNDPSAFISQSVPPTIGLGCDVAAFFLAFLARLREQTTKGILPMQNAVQFYRVRAKSFINLANFTQMHGVAKDQDMPPAKASRASYNSGQAQKRDDRTAVSPEVLCDFFSTMVQSSKQADDLVTPFVSKLAASAPQLAATEFHTLWLPFLRGLVPILVDNGVPLDTPYCQQLFCSLLQAYIDIYLGREPANDSNLVPPRVTGCGCRDCDSLNSFLASTTEQVGYFTVGAYRRMHLHRQLDLGEVECTHQTRRSASPQTLVVTKMFPLENLHEDWVQRLLLARKQFLEFEQDGLKQLLGPDKYAAIAHTLILAAAPARGRQPLQAEGSARVSQSSVVGSKRKAPGTEIEIIDLTQD